MAVYPSLVWNFENFEERSGGETTVKDLVADILAARRQCWVYADEREIRACVLTRVNDGNFRVVEITHCNGRGADDWFVPMLNDLRAWAQEIGASRFRAINRPGWTKMLRGMGLRETHRICEVDLQHEQR